MRQHFGAACAFSNRDDFVFEDFRLKNAKRSRRTDNSSFAPLYPYVVAGSMVEANRGKAIELIGLLVAAMRVGRLRPVLKYKCAKPQIFASA